MISINLGHTVYEEGLWQSLDNIISGFMKCSLVRK